MNTGKDLTEVRSPQRPLVPDIVGLESDEPTFLRAIAIKAATNKQHRFRDLYRCLDAELLLHAWADLNKGAASGVDRVTAQAYAQDLHATIQHLVERLKTKRYRAKLMRRVYKWLNRRGGKRKSFSQEAFWRAVNRGLFRPPRIVAGCRRRVWA